MRRAKGLFAVFKPPGVTSAQTTNTLKKLLITQDHRDIESLKRRKVFKIGHGGTLDKFAEGVLVIGVGDDCKKLSYFQKCVNKCYNATGRLGMTTDSLDCDGIITETRKWEHINEDNLFDTLQQFCGSITQSTPLYSAVKYKGKRMSDYARDSLKFGLPVDIQLPLKQVHIHSISLLSFTPPDFHIAVCCSSGTYIRALVRDIAEKLNTVGHTVHLCRTAQGPFTLHNAIRPDAQGKWNLDCINAAVELHDNK